MYLASSMSVPTDWVEHVLETNGDTYLAIPYERSRLVHVMEYFLPELGAAFLIAAAYSVSTYLIRLLTILLHATLPKPTLQFMFRRGSTTYRARIFARPGPAAEGQSRIRVAGSDECQLSNGPVRSINIWLRGLLAVPSAFLGGCGLFPASGSALVSSSNGR